LVIEKRNYDIVQGPIIEAETFRWEKDTGLGSNPLREKRKAALKK